MRHTLLISFFFCWNIAHAQPSSEMVKKADEQLNDLIKNNRTNEAAGFYADEFILTTSGKTKLKGDMLMEIAMPKLKLEINKTENVEVRVMGTTAVLTGTLHQKGVFKEKAFDAVILVTDTWILTEAGWKLLAGHASVTTKP